MVIIFNSNLNLKQNILLTKIITLNEKAKNTIYLGVIQSIISGLEKEKLHSWCEHDE